MTFNDIKFNETEFKENEELFKLYIKSLIAQNYWGLSR